MNPLLKTARAAKSPRIRICKISKTAYGRFIDKELRKFFLDEFGKGEGADCNKTIAFKERRIHISAKEGKRTIGALVLRLAYRCASVGAFVVEKDWRGAGVGTMLMEECIKLARKNKCRKLWLWTMPGIDAYYFYKRMGFQEEARLRKHFGGSQDLSLMSMFF